MNLRILIDNFCVFLVLQNFTLPNMPSKICHDCHTFLTEIDRRKQLYAATEKLYLELIRLPSRSTADDFARIKTRHNIDEILRDVELASHEKLMEVQNIYVTGESNFLENPGNWNIEIVEETNEPVKIERPKRTSTVKVTNIPKVSKSRLKSSPQKPPIHIQQGFQCDHCSKMFKTKTLITKHITKYHHHTSENLIDIIDSANKSQITSDREFDCNLCTKSFKTVSVKH